SNREQMIVDALPMVRVIAKSLAAELPPNITADDLFSAGSEALLRLADDYDPDRGASFMTYVRQRMPGKMIDYLRSMDSVTSYARLSVKRGRASYVDLQTRVSFESDLSEILYCVIDSPEKLAERH